jgi:hypothetical protein
MVVALPASGQHAARRTDMRTKIIRRAVAALAAAGTVAVAAGSAHAYLPDPVRLTDSEIDFGDSTWVGLLNDPLGVGSVNWSVTGGYYTPELVGTLHLNNAKNEWGRMHIDYYDGAGTLLYTEHSAEHKATDNMHHQWSVNLSPSTPMQIVQARVCTEISNNGSNYSQVDCTGRLYM